MPSLPTLYPHALYWPLSEWSLVHSYYLTCPFVTSPSFLGHEEGTIALESEYCHVWLTITTMATLRLTLNPNKIAKEILPNTASIYRAVSQPAKRKGAFNKKRIMQSLVMYILYWSKGQAWTRLRVDHMNWSISHKYWGKLPTATLQQWLAIREDSWD